MPNSDSETAQSPQDPSERVDRGSLATAGGDPGSPAFPQADAAREPRTVALTLDAGETVPEHTHGGRTVVFICHQGEVTLRVDGERVDLGPGELARFDGEAPVAVEAHEESLAAVVLAPTGE